MTTGSASVVRKIQVNFAVTAEKKDNNNPRKNPGTFYLKF